MPYFRVGRDEWRESAADGTDGVFGVPADMPEGANPPSCRAIDRFHLTIQDDIRTEQGQNVHLTHSKRGYRAFGAFPVAILSLEGGFAMKRIAFFGVVLASLASASLPQEAAHQVFAPQTANDWKLIGESVVHAPMPQIAYVINSSVFVMNEDGTNVRELVRAGVSARSPRFSPDGRRIAYLMHDDGRDGIRILDLSAGDERTITAWHTGSMDWSPDGNVFAYGNIDGGISFINADGTNDRVILPPSGFLGVKSLSFSPDGRRIAFTSFVDSRLFVVNTDGTGLTVLADGEVGEIRTSPSFDPTGTKIAYGFYQTTGKVVGWIRVIDMNGGRDTAAVETGDEPKYVSWSPDDTKIVFHDVVRGRGGLYGIARAGNRWDDLGMLFRSPSSVSDIEWFDPRYAKPVATAPWDVNRDWVVDIRDLILVAQRFGETGTLDADVNGDRVVDIRDLILVVQRFGESVLAAPQRIALVERLSKARSDEDIQSILNELSSHVKPAGKRLVRWSELKTGR
jgi:hypothetical protein